MSTDCHEVHRSGLPYYPRRRRGPTPIPRRIPLVCPGSALACFLGPGTVECGDAGKNRWVALSVTTSGGRYCWVGLVAVIGSLWLVPLAIAPSLATAETEDRSLGRHRFLPVQNLVMNLVPRAMECGGGAALV
ncbi:MAG: hypothetical protein GY832_39950 [Chloroflexi bacterium]|nr:hypothetical protein [Chloroflexota bacterium]